MSEKEIKFQLKSNLRAYIIFKIILCLNCTTFKLSLFYIFTRALISQIASSKVREYERS